MLLTLCLVLVSAADPLQAGAASVDITPDPKTTQVWLAGFGRGRRAEFVSDPIATRALVLADGNRTVALVCADVVGLFDEFTRRVADRLPGIEVVVSATHTHHAPDTMGLWGPGITSGVDPEYLKKVEDACVRAVTEAKSRLKPVVSRLGEIPAGDLLKDSRPPQVKMDPLGVLRFDGTDGKPACLAVLWHNHPEMIRSSHKGISSDYVGPLVDALSTKYGCPVVYLTGVVGGLMSPINLPIKSAEGKELPRASVEATRRYGQIIAERAGTAIDASQPVTLTPLRLKQRDLYLPVENPLYLLGHQLGTLKRTMFHWSGSIDRAAEAPGQGRKALRTRAGILTLGELQIALVPGEIYPELVVGKVPDPAPQGADFPEAPVEPPLLAQMTTKYRWVLGLAQDEIGYIIPKRQWDAKSPYTYDYKNAPYGEINSLGSDTAPLLLPAFRELAR
jgi:hypothetical protein